MHLSYDVIYFTFTFKGELPPDLIPRTNIAFAREVLNVEISTREDIEQSISNNIL